MRNRFVALTAVMGLAALSPKPAKALSLWDQTFCSSGSLVLCNEFSVTDNGSNSYTLTVWNNATGTTIGDYGFLTGLGIFGSSGDYQFDITSATPSWTLIDASHSGTACNDLSATNVNSLDLLAGDCHNGSTTAQMVSITFDSNVSLTAGDFTDGTLIAASHVQGIGTCSGKFYTDGTVLTTPGDGTLDGCVPSTTVPEPASFLLLGTGLLGLAGVKRVRRRRS